MVLAELYSCCVPVIPISAAPQSDAERVSELLYGEDVEIAERSRGWLRVQARLDGYRGWVPDAALQLRAIKVTHRVGQTSGLVFDRPDIKSVLLRRLYRGSPLSLHQIDSDFYELASGGFIHRRHVVAAEAVETCPVDVAIGFLHAPYLWGGRTCDGIDCSALVQTALLACGVACPRDSGDQRSAFSARTITGGPRRGDLVFFPGHVGIMTDSERLLHANAFWMATVIEPLAAVVDRFRPSVADPILAVVRPDCPVMTSA